jgi:aspartokinase-like uncharacterized kinase
MSDYFTRVVKVGGSLFDLFDLGFRVRSWLDAQPSARNILVAGGAWFIEQVRQQSYGDESSDHWTCIVIMDSTARLLRDALPGSELVQNVRPGRFSDLPLVFAPWKWMEEYEPTFPGTRLPESWDVTSDSIAARLAICTCADELVLLKSADPPSRDLQELADAGYVDKFLPKLAGELPPWRIVNLRNNGCHSEGSSAT